MIMGFDVGGTNARGLLVDPATGATVDDDRTSSDGTGPVLLEKLVTMTRDLVDRNGVELTGVGLAIAGLASSRGTVHYSPNLPEIVEFAIGPELEKRVGVPVAVVNDASSGAWAEAKYGAGRGCADMAFVALGTGIGTGFVVDGRLLEGANGFAGEAGHMVIALDGPVHHTGQRGPWEYFASGTALGRLGREAAAAGLFEAGITLAGAPDQITGFHVAEALRAGDAHAAVVFDAFCRFVAIGITNLVLVLDPSRVIIGGGLTDIGEPLRSGVDDWLQQVLLGADHRPQVEVVLAELGSEAGALGAALVVLEDPRHNR